MTPSNPNIKELINFWRQLKLNNKPFIHKKDKDILENIDRVKLSFKDYIKNVNNLFSNNTQIHTGLLPVPYTGDLQKASIFLLMINPGFNHNDYYSETINNYKIALINNMRQENIDKNYPFLFLNPSFCHTSGGVYWLRKFDSLIRGLKDRLRNKTYEDILKHISKNVCSLELFPYHSKNLKINNIVLKCPSVCRIRAIIDELMRRKNTLIVCLRQPENWGVNNNKQIYTLLPRERQSASLKTDTEQGKKILNKLEKTFQQFNK